MKIVQIDIDNIEWPALVEHLREVNDARWVIDDQDQPLSPDLIFLGGVVEGVVAGSLSLARQPIVSPETEWAGDRDRALRDVDGNPLFETLVYTFKVAEAYRRQGIGRALQERAMQITRDLGCIQMRSWSSLDAEANYQLKLSLGFGFHPEIQETPSGLKVSGGYFVKRV
jgi:GNAT superfamily N-acetyltransferase